jgi:UDPglucose 6-dehydrogenase
MPVNSTTVTRIAVIGTGYVGLTTGACFAHLGHDVICADIDPHKIERLSRGEIPIVEYGLDRLVDEGLRTGRLSFVLGSANAAADCEIAFLCVPTPQGEDGAADLSYIEAAAREIGPVLPYEAVVVNKSTVPVGSTKVVERVLGRPDVKVVSNPEFLREGSAVQDFLKPDRVVVGCDDQSAAIKVASLYINVAAPVIVTDPASAETIKYAANAFLATKLSFINAIAAICEGVGADVNDVVLGMGYDKRIGQDFLRPGPGWGGSCFPKDSRALLKIAADGGYGFDLLGGVITVNDQQFERVTDKIRQAAGGSLNGKAIAVWGLTFKARTDDLRDSPSIEVINRLVAAGATVKGFDPTVAGPKAGLPTSIEICSDPYAACAGADVLALMTEWDEFRWLDVAKVADVMNGRAVVDGRNLLDRNEWRRAGYSYQGIGR